MVMLTGPVKGAQSLYVRKMLIRSSNIAENALKRPQKKFKE